MRDFATKNKPLRASALPALVKCGWRAVLLEESTIDDTSGKAADTGSALHAGAAAWHKSERDTSSALKSLRDSIAEFPLADLDDAERQFQAYIADPRNQTAEVVAVEEKVEIEIAPAPHDPTQTPIYVKGTLDQIRLDAAGVPRVWDIKTTARGVVYALHEYTFQLAAYVLAACRMFPAVQPGGFILTRAYLRRGVRAADMPDGVFVEVPWTAEHCDRLLDSVRNRVVEIRSGRVSLGPGDHCRYCPAHGIDGCLPLLLSRTA